MVCAILLILTQAIDSRKDAEIKNEFENITKVEKENNVVSRTSAAGQASIKGKNDSFKDSQKQPNSSPKETDKSSTQTKTSPNSRKTDSPSQKTTTSSQNKSSQTENKVASRTSTTKQNNNDVSARSSTKQDNNVIEPVEITKNNTNIAMAKKPDNNVASRTSATGQNSNDVSARSATKQEKTVVEALETTKNEFSFVTPAKNNAVLVFVFDDGGQNLSQLEKVLSLPFPITVAVLPGLVHSKDSAAKIRQSGNELILHQPMQAVNLNVNPGPGAITPSMNEDEIRSVLFKNIYEIGPIKGVNNHEGSLITADAEKMSYVMKLLSDEGLYFLDSRTNADTKVPFVAKSLGYSYYERNVFLDNTKIRADILGEIKKGLDYANKTGCAIMIGHVWSAEILPAILQEIYPTLVKNGYKFSTVSNCPARIN